METAEQNRRLRIINCRSATAHEDMKREVLRGLKAEQKYLPCKYFYDSRGSALFDRICDLPEYYLTRVELSILQHVAGVVMNGLKQGSLVELGSGANRKIRVLLDAANGSRSRIRYVPVDVCQAALESATEELLLFYPDLIISCIVADFHQDLPRILPHGEKLITFFGSTIGNFSKTESDLLFRKIASLMEGRDRLLVGLDLVKERKILEAAYNDAQGTTAAFNKNILLVMNRELSASFDISEFDHIAFYNDDSESMQMHLRAKRSLTVNIEGLEFQLHLNRGETIFTEISRKFRRETVEAMAAGAGLRLTDWFTDRNGWFALAQFRKAKSEMLSLT